MERLRRYVCRCVCHMFYHVFCNINCQSFLTQCKYMLCIWSFFKHQWRSSRIQRNIQSPLHQYRGKLVSLSDVAQWNDARCLTKLVIKVQSNPYILPLSGQFVGSDFLWACQVNENWFGCCGPVDAQITWHPFICFIWPIKNISVQNLILLGNLSRFMLFSILTDWSN